MRFQLFAVGVMIFTASAIFAAPPEAKPEDGWVKLFDGTTTFGWTVEGDVKVKDGRIMIGHEKPGKAIPTAWLGTAYECEIQATSGVFHIGDRELRFKGATIHTLSVDSWLKGQTGGQSLKITPNSDVTDRHRPKTKETERQLFSLEGSPDAPMTVTSIVIRPTGQKPIFDGKTLAGWKKYTGDAKREKSTFDVTKAGELQVKDGPGDLQTEKSFQDFVLHVDCKTNGKLLNSGVFFRCLPGQYQQGYEAQIQNGFKDNDRSKPTDFGTGAIYRRIATRKVVPNDDEWFVMTVAAVGSRLRTWVNGEPTVDWVDDRPANDNARNGQKTAGGPISIQGHDPTTNLLFRNLKIVEIK